MYKGKRIQRSRIYIWDKWEILITCADYNDGSRNSIKSFDGVLEKTTYNELDGETMELYWIDVNNAINKYRNEFEKFIERVDITWNILRN